MKGTSNVTAVCVLTIFSMTVLTTSLVIGAWGDGVSVNFSVAVTVAVFSVSIVVGLTSFSVLTVSIVTGVVVWMTFVVVNVMVSVEVTGITIVLEPVVTVL